MGRIKGKTTDWVDEGFKANTFNKMRSEGEIRELLPVDEVEFKGLSKQYFEKRNVHENRILGQRIGLEAATTLSKGELVDKLVEKVWGLQDFNPGYKERKAKVDINTIPPELEIAILEDVKNGEVIIAEEAEGVFYHTTVGNTRIGGLLYNVGAGFNDVIIDTCVLRNLVGEYGLNDGDYIKGRVKYYPELKFYCLIKIDYLNGKPTLTPSRPDFSSQPVKPSEKIKMESTDRIVLGLNLFSPVCYGQFGLISTASRIDFSQSAMDIYKAINPKECDCKLFLLEEKEVVYNQCKQYEHSQEIYYTPIGGNTDQLKLVLKFMQAQAREGGKKEVLIINDIDRLAPPAEAVRAVRELSALAGAYDNGGSLTIIALAATTSPLGTYFTLRNNLDFELSLKAGADITQSTMDVLSSYSFSIREPDKDETIAVGKLKQYALTAGISAAERLMLSCGGNVQNIIRQLNV